MNYLIAGKNGSGKTYFCVDMIFNLYQDNLSNLKSNSDSYSQNYSILEELDIIQLHSDFCITFDDLLLDNNKVYSIFEDAISLRDGVTDQFKNIEDGLDFTDYFRFHIIYNDFIKYVLKKNTSLKLKYLKPVHQLMADINGIKIDTVYLSPVDWRTAPLGSKIFYDEFQDRPEFLFDGNRPSKNPMILELSKIRHYDIDLFLITPDPDNLHKSLRKIIHIFYFVKRPHGNPKCCSIYTFDQFLSNPRAAADSKIEPKKYSEYKLLNYKKSIQRLYTSAANHSSMGFQIPWKWLRNAVFVILGFVIIVSLLFKIPIFGFFADAVRGMIGKDNNLSKLQNSSTSPEPSPNSSFANPSSSLNLDQECRKGVNVEKPECVKWFNDLSNSKTSVSQSAEVINTVSYDPSNPFQEHKVSYEVTAKPVFSGCANFNGRYIAYTQQGTRLKVSESDCKRIINDGDRPFDYFAKEKPVQASQEQTDAKTEESATYKKAYLENMARIDAEKTLIAQNSQVKTEAFQVDHVPDKFLESANRF